MTTVYSAGRRVVRVRFVMWLMLLLAAALVWKGYGFMQSPLPPAWRLGVGIGFPLMGLAMFAGMTLYGRCYIERIDYDATAGTLLVRTVRLLGVHELSLSPSDILGTRHHSGDGAAEHAPYTSVRIRGHRLPLILDEAGEFQQREVLGLR